MKITARVREENSDLVDTLTNRGITAKLVRGGVIVELPMRDSNISEFEIPAEIKDATLLLNVTEHGGGATKTGSSTVVCGVRGEALRPYYVPHSGHLSCETHAYFAVRGAVVTISVSLPGTNVKIEEHRIVRNGSIARIESQKLWDGRVEELPETFDHFQHPVEAAFEKADCYHCRCVHFATERR